MNFLSVGHAPEPDVAPRPPSKIEKTEAVAAIAGIIGGLTTFAIGAGSKDRKIGKVLMVGGVTLSVLPEILLLTRMRSPS